MANTKNKNKKNVSIEATSKPKLVCVCCGSNKQTDFYVSNNDDYKYFKKIPWCKNCIDSFYLDYFTTYDDNQKAVYYLCRKINIPFSFAAFEGAKRNSEKKGWKIYQSYIKQINSLGNVNNHGVCFDDTKDNIEATFVKDFIDENNFEATDEMIKYWGKSRDSWEYEYLDEEMFKIKTSFECPDYGMEMLMKDICFINLDIEKSRQGIEKSDVTKLIDARSKLMNDAKMKPIQATGAESNDQITFGTLIKKLENDKPTDEPLDEWKDPDNFKKWHTIFVGHLADMNDIENDVVRDYKEIIKPYTVTRSDEEDGDE